MRSLKLVFGPTARISRAGRRDAFCNLQATFRWSTKHRVTYQPDAHNYTDIIALK